MNITFATPANMNIFWGNVKTLLGFAAPWVMIAVAIIAVGLLLMVVIRAFKDASKEDDPAHRDDDGYEVKHY